MVDENQDQEFEEFHNKVRLEFEKLSMEEFGNEYTEAQLIAKVVFWDRVLKDLCPGFEGYVERLKEIVLNIDVKMH